MKHGCGRGTASLLDIVLEGGADRNGVEGGCSRRHLDDIVDDRGDYSTRRTAVPQLVVHPERRTLLVGGVDVHHDEENQRSVAAYVVLRYDNETTTTTRVVHQSHKWYVPEVPYVPSYLAYREMDPVIDLIDRQVKSRPDLTPDVVLVDGNGVWHERKAGIATFVGVRTGLPTVGIGKTFYSIGGMMTRRDMHQRIIDALDAWYNEEAMQERDNGRSIGATSGRGTRLANRRLLLDVVSTAPPAQSVEGGRDVTRRGLAVPVERILEALHQSANGIAIPMKDPRATAEDDDNDDEPLAYALGVVHANVEH
jgi:deoxyinosine 3'endonuclease (endonuclease V)